MEDADFDLDASAIESLTEGGIDPPKKEAKAPEQPVVKTTESAEAKVPDDEALRFEEWQRGAAHRVGSRFQG